MKKTAPMMLDSSGEATEPTKDGMEKLRHHESRRIILGFFFAKELRRFPTLESDIVAAANEALERFQGESKKTILRLVDMYHLSIADK
ncbi:dynamin-related protein 1C [Senna tora]|uniref:Dynamin-related protein 1C n=1 Tax=Senna tora TaxID=362788 RepID=A0A834WNF8_9FABA|nr:dynamin-related protein 1C [Senna tora]